MLELFIPYTPSYKSADFSMSQYESTRIVIYQTYEGDYPCPPDYYGNTFSKSQINYSDMYNIPSSVKIKGDDEKLNLEYIQRGIIYNQFKESFYQHSGDNMPEEAAKEFERMAELLSELPIRESLVQYSNVDNMIDFLLILNDGIRLSIGKFTDEDDIEELVEFTVYNKKELLLSGEITIKQLVKKIKRIHTIQL